jgi:hypothetical protein
MVALALVIGAVLGAGLIVSPIVPITVVAVALLAAVVAFFDIFGLAVVLIGVLPWLIVMSDVLPRLTVTLAAGAAAVVVLGVAMPRSQPSSTSLFLRLGAALFFIPIILSLVRDGLGVGFTQAAKYVVFPLMVFAIAEATNHRDLFRLRTLALWSSVAAISINLLLGFSGVANIHYYGAGEILGLGSEHALALLAGCVTGALLASATSFMWAPAIAVCAVATVATGVRSPLPGLAAAALARMVTGRVRLRMIVLVGLAVFGIFASGAAGVVEQRFQQGENRGEYQSLSSLGSGRGEIYSAALAGYRDSGPMYWITGTGLRSILRFEQERLGETFVGHSDVVEVGVQLGVMGLLGLLLIWRVLIQRAQSKLLLFVLGSFALFNGVLEYSGPVVIAILLTAGLPRGSALSEDSGSTVGHKTARNRARDALPSGT